MYTYSPDLQIYCNCSVCVHLTHYILSVLTRPSSYAKLLSCKQSHNECPDVGLHYCFGSLACLNGCLKPSYTAVKNGLNYSI